MSIITTLTRIIQMQSATGGELATIPSSNDHTDGTWTGTDVYPGELFINYADGTISFRTAAGIRQLQVGTTDAMLYSANVYVPSGSVETLHSSPYTIIAAPPAGYAIDVISATVKLVYGDTPYATVASPPTGNILILSLGDSTTASYGDNGVLISSASAIAAKLFPIYESEDTAQSLLPHAALKLSASVSDPADGNSALVVNVLYRIVSIT